MTDLFVGGPEGPDDDSGDQALLDSRGGLVAERERLARTLRDTRMQLAMTQARLTALEQSSTMRFGKMLVNAAKRPWPRGVTLPRDLLRLYRERGGGRDGAQLAAKLAAAQLADLAGAGERFLSSLTVPGRQDVPALGLVIAGALTARGTATLAPDAVVHPLLPHDADVLLESTGADLVIIEAAALLAGASWAYAADPSGSDRGRRLARLIVMARSLNKPVVLVRNVPPHLHASMDWIAESCDVVTDGGLGTQLARFNPIGLDPSRPSEPVYAGARDPRESPSVRSLLDSVSELVTLAAPRSWRGLPDLYRAHALFVTADQATAREQAACGARVISLDGYAGDAAGLRQAIEVAREEGAPSGVDVRAGIRDIFMTDATAARLAGFASATGLGAGIVAGRQLAVVAADGWNASTLASFVLRQKLKPAEVILGAGSLDDSMLAPLTDQGITVRVVSPGSVTGLAPLATAPWVAPLPSGPPPESASYLLDLAAARECSQADAVGFSPADYSFVTTLESPALARRELLGPGAPPVSSWGVRGYRLFSVKE
jgi:hypothetical protein